MKAKYTLSENEIKDAIKAYVKAKKGIEVSSVYLRYYQADSRDPREVSFYSADVSE